MTNQNLLTPSQIEQLSSLRYINKIDDHMRIVSSIKLLDKALQNDNDVLLVLDIFFDTEQVETMSFNLHNYSYEEIVEIAQNVRENDYILRAVDTALAGDIE